MWRNIDFKEWTYILHPRPVAIIAARYGSRLSAMPASWVTPVSREPPVIAIAIARNRYTYELIVKSGEFSVNILTIDYIDKIHFLGSVSGRDFDNKISAAGLNIIRARRIDAPIISEAVVVAECRLMKDIESGDHNIVTGEILEIYAREEYDICDTSYLTKVPLHIMKNRYIITSTRVIEV